MLDPEVAALVWLSKALLLGFLGGVAAIVGFRLLGGGIHIKGMLAASDGGPASPERVQLLVISLGCLWSYAMSALDQGTLPEPPDWLLGVFVASNLTYVSGKWGRRFWT